jgi:hypothetical protein
VYAVYEPKSGDSYTIKINGRLRSSGTVTVNKASAKMTFCVEGTGATFEASVTSTGGALTFSAGIKTNEGIPDITIKIDVETPTPPFIEEPIGGDDNNGDGTNTGGESGSGSGSGGGSGSGSGGGSGSGSESGGTSVVTSDLVLTGAVEDAFYMVGICDPGTTIPFY